LPQALDQVECADWSCCSPPSSARNVILSTAAHKVHLTPAQPLRVLEPVEETEEPRRAGTAVSRSSGVHNVTLCTAVHVVSLQCTWCPVSQCVWGHLTPAPLRVLEVTGRTGAAVSPPSGAHNVTAPHSGAASARARAGRGDRRGLELLCRRGLGCSGDLLGSDGGRVALLRTCVILARVPGPCLALCAARALAIAAARSASALDRPGSSMDPAGLGGPTPTLDAHSSSSVHTTSATNSGCRTPTSSLAPQPSRRSTSSIEIAFILRRRSLTTACARRTS